jgi:hypothetical protein
MMTAGDENGDDSVSVSAYSQNPNSGKTDQLVASQNRYLRIKARKTLLGIA